MKRMTIRISAALSVLLLLCAVFALPFTEAADAQQRTRVKPAPSTQRQQQQQRPATPLPPFDAATGLLDAAGKLSASERAALQKRIREIGAKHKIGVGIAIIQSLGGRQPRPTARAYLNDSGYNASPNGGTLLLLAMQNRKWYFVTDKKMQQALLDEFATKKIEKDLVPNMKEGKVAEACDAYLDVVDAYTEHYLETGSAYSDSDPPPEDRILLTGLGAITAALGAFAAKFKLRMGMSNVLPAVDADAYMRQDSLGLNRLSEEFLYTDVTVTHHSSSNDDGGSSGGSDDGGGGGGGDW